METSETETGNLWVKRAGFALLGFVVFIVLAHAFWGWVANRRLNATIAMLRAKGEPMTLAEMPKSEVPDSRNASLDFKAAAVLTNLPAADSFILDQFGSGFFVLPYSKKECDALNSIITSNKAAINLVKQARGKAVGSWKDEVTDANLTVSPSLNFNEEREFSHLIQATVIDAHGKGDDAEAIRCVRDIFSLERAEIHRPFVISRLATTGIGWTATQTIGHCSAELKLVDAESRRQATLLIEELLDTSDIASASPATWQTERMRELAQFYDLTNGWHGYLFRPILLRSANRMATDFDAMIKAEQQETWPAARSLIPAGATRNRELEQLGEVERHQYLSARTSCTGEIFINSQAATFCDRVGNSTLSG